MSHLLTNYNYSLNLSNGDFLLPAGNEGTDDYERFTVIAQREARSIVLRWLVEEHS